MGLAAHPCKGCNSFAKVRLNALLCREDFSTYGRIINFAYHSHVALGVAADYMAAERKVLNFCPIHGDGRLYGFWQADSVVQAKLTLLSLRYCGKARWN